MSAPDAPRVRTLRLRDGSRVGMRPIEPYDKPALEGGFERLSADSRYRRFMSPTPRLTSAMLAYLTEIDHHDHEALVALDPTTRDALGVARYVRAEDDPTVAEAAVTVVDDWQGRGLGSVLVEELAQRAREEGVHAFTALVLASNPGAIRVLEGLGESELSHDGQYVKLRIELPPRRGLGPQLAGLLREAATGSLVAAGGLLQRATGVGARAPLVTPEPGTAFATIVAGTDGSRGAGEAVRLGVQLAAALRSQLHLVSAHGLLGAGDARRALDEAARRARGRGLEPFSHARRGDPADVLVTVAEEVDARLVVVGSRGMGSASRFALGGVPDKVTHYAPCSVLVVRGTPAR